MSPAQRVLMAHRAAAQAIAEMVCADNALRPDQAAALIAHACAAEVRAPRGSESAAEVGYVIGDAMAVTPG